MALPKAVRFGVLLLVLCFTLDRPGFRQSASIFFEELRDATSSMLFAREKREILTNFTEYDFQLVITFSDLESLQEILRNISFPISTNNTVEITSIETTTVCSPNITGYQCTCEQNFAWSYNNCITYGVCDTIIGDKCGCIKDIPADGQFCQLNSSQIVTTPSPTYEIDLVLEIRIPLSGYTPDQLDVFREALRNETFLIPISKFVNIIELNLTTVCYPNSIYGLQCQCESGFAWPCDVCNSNTSCSSQICTCIYGLPSNDKFCQPITSNATCPTPPAPVDIDVEIVVRIPTSTVPSNIFDYFRYYLRTITYPITVSQSLAIKEVSFTTACNPNSDYGLQCQCENGFAWPCDICNSNKSCSNQACTCLIGLPSNDKFCQPISSNTTCSTLPDPVDIDVEIVVRIPTSTVPSNIFDYFRYYLRTITYPITVSQSLAIKEVSFTTACNPNSDYGLQCQCENGFAWPCDICNSNKSCSNQTCTCLIGLPSNDKFCQPVTNVTICEPTPTPSTDPVDIDVEIVVRIPTSTVPSNIFDYFRYYLQAITYPITVSQSLAIKNVSFTTACNPTPAYGLQCQCENGFAWPCDMCNSNKSCSNQTCTCLIGLPSNDKFCQPVTSNTTCSTLPDPVDIDVEIVVRIPTSTVPSNIFDYFRYYLQTITYPITVSQSLAIKKVSFTTACNPNSDYGLQCQCENGFAWPCDMCNSNKSCSNQTCTCLIGLPSNDKFCQPVTNVTICEPTPTPSTVKSTPMTISTAPPPPTMVIPTTPTTGVITINSTTVIAPTPQVISGKITMEMPFSNSFNDKDNIVYKTIYNATEEECTKHVSKDCKVMDLTFSEGSTIAKYDLSVTSTTPPTNTQIQLTQDGILTQVASKYPVSILSKDKIQVNTELFYVGDPLTVTCHIPSLLGPANTFPVLWTHNGNTIANVSSSLGGTSTYTFTKFLEYNDGNYECKVIFGAGSTFRQTVELKSKPAPLINAQPDRETLKCADRKILTCSVNSDFTVTLLSPDGVDLKTASYEYIAPSECVEGNVVQFTCKTQPKESKKAITLVLTRKNKFDCTDPLYGNALVGAMAVADCETNKEGQKTAVCMADGQYGDKQDNCVLKVIVALLDRSEVLTELSIPVFLEDLRNATAANKKDIIESPATIIAVVKIFENVANASLFFKIKINDNSTRNFLESAGLLTIDDARNSWAFLNYNDTRNTTEDILLRKSSSSAFLNVFENLTTFISPGSINIYTDFILLNKTTLTNPFNTELNSSVEIEIPEGGGENKLITIIIFASMYNVLPGRDEVNTSSNRVHGRVALVRPEVKISNISLTFDIINYTNDTLGQPKCVFWDFNLFEGLGGWSDNGCSLVYYENETVSCNCNHTTSFSILMSPNSPRSLILDYITYIGVGISMACLVICLIIEAIIWRKINKNATSYLRHVSIVNIAVSLLIADIWFIIGAAISDANVKNPPACTAATFFIHFFYLALFFWMLASGLLLLYRTLSVFEGGLSKMSMLIIGFCLGYGAPLLIATITIAATAPSNQYIRENVVCWLNWDGSKALLAFVIPALSIVVINLIILIVVLYKILRRRVGGNAAQAGEKHVLVVIARSLAVLTPFFGLTWGLGVGTMVSPQNIGIHIAFAFFNSLQGFFILVFGTLLDNKVLSALTIRSLTSQGRTGSTSAGTSSSGLGKLFRRMRGDRGSRSGYHVSSTGQSGYTDSLNT